MKGDGRVLTASVHDNRQQREPLTSEAVVTTTPSTQRAPSNDNVADQAARESWRASSTPTAAESSPLDGLHEVEELSIETWLHLSLGLETG